MTDSVQWLCDRQTSWYGDKFVEIADEIKWLRAEIELLTNNKWSEIEIALVDKEAYEMWKDLNGVKSVDDLLAEVERLRAQLPEGMKHCTIQFAECEKGHGRLTASNWVEHGCSQCEIERLRAALQEIIRHCEICGPRARAALEQRR